MKRSNCFRRLVTFICLILMVSQIHIPTQAASKIKLNKKSVTITVGKTSRIKVLNTKKKITWSSKNKKVATVSKTGLVKGIKAGNTTITAKIGKTKLNCKVTVKKLNTKSKQPTITPKPTVMPKPTITPTPTTMPTPTPDTIPTIKIQAGNKSFTLTMYDNDSARALVDKLPLTLNMDELNRNEKYYFFSERFPTDSKQVGSIKAGDLMLYGSDCLVLFYEGLSTSYSYTRLGYVDDITGLKAALGSGSVQVTFSINN